MLFISREISSWDCLWVLTLEEQQQAANPNERQAGQEKS